MVDDQRYVIAQGSLRMQRRTSGVDIYFSTPHAAMPGALEFKVPVVWLWRRRSSRRHIVTKGNKEPGGVGERPLAIPLATLHGKDYYRGELFSRGYRYV
ncbi:hypothetical protein J6590_089581 [Homalodisca vitripennis]|nr:hypothetical protein J6590_089581 [Homalodisca vitripennis]